MKAQKRFICALSSAIEMDVDIANSKLVYADYRMNGYTDHTIIELLERLKESLHSTYDFSNRCTPVDGIIRNHKLLGTRVVEFDEFQHFTAQRKLSIAIANAYHPLDFHKRYLNFLDNAEVIAECEKVTRRTGFRKPVHGFQYAGGRMSQRAYFDTMKDYVHLSERGMGFKSTLRFSIADFGVTSETKFLELDSSLIEERISNIIEKC